MSTKKTSINKILHTPQVKFICIATIAYLIFLYALPMLLSFAIPCLSGDVNSSFGYDVCNIDIAMKHYSIVTLVVLAAAILGYFFRWQQYRWQGLVVLGLLLASAAIIGFHTYIPKIQEKLDTIPRYVPDSDLQPNPFNQ